MHSYLWELTTPVEQDQDLALSSPLTAQEADEYKLERFALDLRGEVVEATVISLCSGVEIKRESTMLTGVDFNEVAHWYCTKVGDIESAQTATSGSATTITKTGAGWTTNEFRHKLIEVTAGTNGGEMKRCSGNTSDTLTFPAMPVACDGTTQFTVRTTCSTEIERVVLEAAMVALGYAGTLV